jgi:hypothetical protein
MPKRSERWKLPYSERDGWTRPTHCISSRQSSLARNSALSPPASPFSQPTFLFPPPRSPSNDPSTSLRTQGAASLLGWPAYMSRLGRRSEFQPSWSPRKRDCQTLPVNALKLPGSRYQKWIALLRAHRSPGAVPLLSNDPESLLLSFEDRNLMLLVPLPVLPGSYILSMRKDDPKRLQGRMTRRLQRPLCPVRNCGNLPCWTEAVKCKLDNHSDMSKQVISPSPRPHVKALLDCT